MDKNHQVMREFARKSRGWAMAFLIAFGIAGVADTANANDRVDALSDAKDLTTLVERIGREPDRSEQGGACGGILIHDWDSERIRAITLGGMVQAVSTLAGTEEGLGNARPDKVE